MILLRKEGDAFLSVYASGGLTCRRVDRAALKAVAAVSDINGAFKIELKEGLRLDDLELALVPIVPVESARIKTPQLSTFLPSMSRTAPHGE